METRAGTLPRETDTPGNPPNMHNFQRLDRIVALAEDTKRAMSDQDDTTVDAHLAEIGDLLMDIRENRYIAGLNRGIWETRDS